MGIYMPHDVNTVDVLLELPNLENGNTVPVPGTLVRAKCSADGWYDVGVLFRLPALRRSHADMNLPPITEAVARRSALLQRIAES
jgi:hypothetical protein